MIRVVIVDDHEIVRRGIVAILHGDPGFEVVGEAGDGEEALRLIRATHPDVALVDSSVVQECIRAGAKGYVLKDVASTDLRRSIREIARGGSPVDPRAARMMLHWLHQGENSEVPDRFTLREIEILRLIAEGLPNREIAQRLCLSENTIKTYIQNLYQKLDAHNRIEAVMRATRRGIL